MAKIKQENILIKFSALLPDDADENFTIATEEIRLALENFAKDFVYNRFNDEASIEAGIPPLQIITEAVIQTNQ